MSPASYLTAPPRDAARIVALRHPRSASTGLLESASESQKPRAKRGEFTGCHYDGGVGTAAWIALGFFSVAVVASLIFVGLRALNLWRAFWSFSRTATTAFDRVTRAAASAEEHSTSLTENQARLMRATERLQISLTQIALLRAAAAEARAAVDRLRGVVPTK